MSRLRPTLLLLALALTACAAPPARGRFERVGVRFGSAGLYSGQLAFEVEAPEPDREFDFESNAGLALSYESNFDDRLAGNVAMRYLPLDWTGPNGTSGDGDWLDASAGLRWYFTNARERHAIEPFVSLDVFALLRGNVGDDIESALGLSIGTGVLLWLHTDFAIDAQAKLLAARGAFTLSNPDYRAWALEVAGSYWF